MSTPLSCLRYRSFDVEGHFSAPMGQPKHLWFPSICSSLVSPVKGVALLKPFHACGGSTLATEGMVPKLSVSSGGGRTSQTPHGVEPDGTTPNKEVSQEPGVAMPTCLEVIKQLFRKAGFCKEFVEVITDDIRKSTVVRIPPLIALCKATVQKIA